MADRIASVFDWYNEMFSTYRSLGDKCFHESERAANLSSCLNQPGRAEQTRITWIVRTLCGLGSREIVVNELGSHLGDLDEGRWECMGWCQDDMGDRALPRSAYYSMHFPHTHGHEPR